MDIRKGAPIFGHWSDLDLSAENKKQIWIPAGSAYGFLVTSDSAEFLYKTTDYQYPEFELSIFWGDPAIGIDLPLRVLSEPPLFALKNVQALTLNKRIFNVG